MATIDDLIAQIEVEFETAEKRAKKCGIEMTAILNGASSEGRNNTTEEEDLRIAELHAARDQYRKDMAGAKKKLEDAKRVKSEDAEIERESREAVPTGAQRATREQRIKVGREERTYHPGNDRRGQQFLRDVARQFLYNDVQANARLTQHMAEERVERQGQYMERAAGDTLTSNWTGLVVPQYITDLKAPAIAALRPFANICNPHDLPPDGMSVNISRVTTASSAALQATELATVSATSLDDTLLTESVQTAAGQQTLSRQAIDRGTGIEETVMDDLFRRYATTLDSTLLNQATTGLSAVATATAFTTASPAFMSATAADSLYGKIIGATAGVEAALLAYGFPTHVVMNSRRWHWINSKVAAVWPGVAQPGGIPTQAGGLNVGAGYDQGSRGTLPNGLTVIVDNNVGTAFGTATNEDEIYVVPASECHLWEDPNAPVFIRAEQPAAASLGVLLVLYGYFAYSLRRYSNGMGKVGGTGLTVPTF
jgi:HK97 family phage major capsid protein